MRLLQFLFISLSFLFISGCISLSDPYKGYAVKPLDYSLNKFMKRCPDGIINSGQCKSQDLRLELYAAMEDSESKCVEHIKSIYGNDAFWNISTGSFASLTAGWAAITSGAQAKTLAALSAFSSGERSLVNETVYKNQVTNSITIKISEMREQKGNEFISKLNSGAYDGYNGTISALHDLNDYHNSCSFYKGLDKALKEGTDSTPALKLNELKLARENQLNQLLIYKQSHDKSSKTNDEIYKSMAENLESLEAEIKSRKPQTQAQKTNESTVKSPDTSPAESPKTATDPIVPAPVPVSDKRE